MKAVALVMVDMKLVDPLDAVLKLSAAASSDALTERS